MKQPQFDWKFAFSAGEHVQLKSIFPVLVLIHQKDRMTEQNTRRTRSKLEEHFLKKTPGSASMLHVSRLHKVTLRCVTFFLPFIPNKGSPSPAIHVAPVKNVGTWKQSTTDLVGHVKIFQKCEKAWQKSSSVLIFPRQAKLYLHVHALVRVYWRNRESCFFPLIHR